MRTICMARVLVCINMRTVSSDNNIAHPLPSVSHSSNQNRQIAYGEWGGVGAQNAFASFVHISDLSFNCFNGEYQFGQFLHQIQTHLIKWFTFRSTCSNCVCVIPNVCVWLDFPVLLQKHFTKATHKHKHTKTTNFSTGAAPLCLQQLVKIVFIEKTVSFNVNLMFSNFQQVESLQIHIKLTALADDSKHEIRVLWKSFCEMKWKQPTVRT